MPLDFLGQHMVRRRRSTTNAGSATLATWLDVVLDCDKRDIDTQA